MTTIEQQRIAHALYMKTWYRSRTPEQRSKIAERKKHYEAAHAEETAKYRKEYWAQHIERKRELGRLHYKKQKAAGIEPRKRNRIAYRKWYAENRREQMLASQKKAKKLHRANVFASCARRRAKKLQATPTWANAFFITEAYRLALLRSKVTGIKWHVDHIVPLRSPIVCGLHVENNLNVISASQNQSKGNRVWPHMP